ncbi:MAG: DUF4198 domain-containing protein [Bacillota bacterium]
MLNVAQGHEIWVLPEAGHARAGHEARCRVYYGHAMRPDGLADLARLSAWAVAPGGEKVSLKAEPGDNQFHLVAFMPGIRGFWAVTVENAVGPIAVTGGLYRRGTRKDYPDAREVGYYHQYAKTHFQVGHFCTACGGVEHPAETVCLGHDLELVAEPGAHRVGDKLLLEVRYRGRPLPGAIVQATWSLREGKDWALGRRSDAAGRVQFVLENPGHWLFYTRFADETLGKEGEYDKLVYSATLSLFGVR